MKKHVLVAILCLSISVSVLCQASHPPITNADIISMSKSGIGEETIVLAIQQGVSKFDTSPQALVELKKEGVGDKVLGAMLSAPHAAESAKISEEKPTTPGGPLLQKALNAIGSADRLAAIHSFRSQMHFTTTSEGAVKVYERETIRVYPEKEYFNVHNASGQSRIQVITPEFSYRHFGKMSVAVPNDYLQAALMQMQLDRINIAQHPADCNAVSEGQDMAASQPVDKLRITCSGQEVMWLLDSQSGRLLSATTHTVAGDTLVQYSDYRLVDGLYVAFKQHVTEPGGTIDQTITDFHFNPDIDDKLFQRPKDLAAESLTLKVLQAQSVPYTQESGGGVNTSCNISGSANSSATVNSVGSTAYGSGTSTSNMRMNCNSYDTTIRWPHVLNTMFVEASDGNAYIIACDRAWRWSKCVPLRTGQSFSARFTGKGIEVQAFNSKGKEGDPVYQVLQSKSMR